MSMGRKHFGNNLSKVEDPRQIREDAEKAAEEEARNLAGRNRPAEEINSDRKNFVSFFGGLFRVRSKDRHDK